MFKHNYLKVISCHWASGKQCIGVVAVYSPKEKLFHGYIGRGAGFDEREDIIKIIDLGSRLPRHQTISFFPEIDKLVNSKEHQWKG